MGLNSTVSANRLNIGFFGKRNAGKSSLVNAVTGQELSVVSDVLGTTTDPVLKTMELLPLGPVVIIDTPGFDDVGLLGEMRVKKTLEILRRVDIAVLAVDATVGFTDTEKELVELFKQRKIPFVTVYNKADLLDNIPQSGDNEIYVSATENNGIFELKEMLSKIKPKGELSGKLVGDLLNSGDVVLLITPIDSAAPKGRLILPQQQIIRDILDADAIPVAVKENAIKTALDSIKNPPKLVITDSQAFAIANREVPDFIPLTSFSIIMARSKGFLQTAVNGVKAIKALKDGDTVLISEGCTHHRQCGDIGSVKIPALLRKFTGKNINIELSSGNHFPDDLSKYALVIHCGGCMLNNREMQYRMETAIDNGIPFTNYGTALAFMNGILERSITPIPEAIAEFRK